MTQHQPKELFKRLFDSGETITLAGPAPQRGGLYKIGDLYDHYDLIDYVYYSVNPHSGPVWPRHKEDSNISAFRNVVIEFDRGDYDKQLALIKRRKIPYTGLVHSGGKSVHVILSLAEACPDFETYDKLTEMIYAAIDPTFNQERTRTGLDRKCRNPGRLTRIPGIVRPETGIEQNLIDLKERVTEEELVTFLEANQKRIDRYMKKEADKKAQRRSQREMRKLVNSGKDKLPIKDTTLALITRGKYPERTSRHDALLFAGLDLQEAGYDIGEIEEKLEQASQLIGIDGRGDVAGIIKWLMSN